jgi:hypothetical protein
MNFIKIIGKKLRELRDSNRIAQAKIKAHKRQQNEAIKNALFSLIGIRLDPNKKRTTSGVMLWLHSIIAVALFAGTIYLLVINYVGKGQKPFHGAVFLTFLVPIVYLLVVHFLSKKRR